MLSYALILIIPLAVGSFAYLEAAKTLRKGVVDANLSMLEQTRDVVDSRIGEVGKIVNQLSLNTKVRRFANLDIPYNIAEYYNVRELSRELQQYKITDDFISSFFITYRNSGIVVSPTTVYDLSFFYDTFFTFGDIDNKLWRQTFVNGQYLNDFIPSTKVVFEENNFNVITYVRTILKEHSADTVNLMLFINEKDIQKLLKKVNYYNHGWVYIVNGNGKFITSLTGRDSTIPSLQIPNDSPSGYFEKKISNESMTVVYANSSQNDWRYVSVVPSKIVMDKVSHIRNITIGVTCASLIMGFIIAVYLSYKKSKPILEILQMAAGFFEVQGSEKEDEYEVLKNTFSDIIIKNKDLESAIQAQIPMMKATFFDNLIKGEYRTQLEIENIMKQIGINIEGKYFSIIMISINGYYANINEEVVKELAINRIIIENVISQNVENGYIHFVGENKLALLIGYDNGSIEECKLKVQGIIQNISEKLQGHHNLSIMFAAGEVCNELIQIVQSYEQAANVLEYKLMKRDNSVLWHHEIPLDDGGYYYPIDLEARIINIVKAGDFQTIKGYLDNIYEENIVKRNLSVEAMVRLLQEMKGTFYKINSEAIIDKSVEEKIKKLKCSGNTEDKFRIIGTIYEELCNNVIKIRKDNENQLVKDILEYINQNYSDVNFSPGIVASNFSISEAYFPHFFKGEIGETFSTVLENIRIQKACELLNTDMTIKDIAEKVGYSGDKTFRRAFKRVKGVSPSEFSGRK